MTEWHPAHPTQPRRLGPPGDEVGPVPDLHPEDIEDELARAEYELLFALARHRKCWKNARELRDHIQSRGGYPDADLTYKKATGDITWWRGEMEAQGTVVLALHKMLETRVDSR